MLPTIVCFCDGIAIDRIVGFEELGGVDEFPTMILTRRLIDSGVLMAKNKKERGDTNFRGKKNRRDDSDCSESDWLLTNNTISSQFKAYCMQFVFNE